MTIKISCLALASNREQISRITLPVRGIDGFVESTQGPVVKIDHVPTESLRSHIAGEIAVRLEDARRMGIREVAVILGHRTTWTDKDLIAVDLGVLDGTASIPSQPIARH